MKENFKSWLKSDDLYEYYQNNPGQQAEILMDYLHESEHSQIFKDIEGWITWVCNNPELGKERFPIHVHKLEEKLRLWPSYKCASIIQDLPLTLHKLRISIEELTGKTRTKEIKQGLELCSLLLDQDFDDEIITAAIDSVKDELVDQREYLLQELNAPKSKKAQSENLRNILKQYGFFGIPKVACLTEEARLILFELIYDSELPYVIAMLDYLDFIRYLERIHFSSKYELCREMAKWFQKSERSIKGNINSLLKNSRENKTRYTAHLQKEIVAKQYLKLK